METVSSDYREEKRRLCSKLAEELDAASSDMSLLTNNAKGFLHFYSYQKSLEEWNQTERNAEKELRVFQLFKGDQYKRLKKTYELYQNNLRQFYADVETHNRAFLKNEAEPADDSHSVRIERVEDEYYLSSGHEMKKTISFLLSRQSGMRVLKP